MAAAATTTRAANEPVGMAEFCSLRFIPFISKESQPRVCRRLCLAPHHSSRREIDVFPPSSRPTPIRAPLLPLSQIQARCQRENKQKTDEEKQKGVDGFSANAMKGLFTSEEEEPASCQAAGGGRRWWWWWAGGPPGTSLAAEEATKQVDGVIYLFLFFLFLTEWSSRWTHDSDCRRNTKHQQSPGQGRRMVPGSH